MAGSQLGRTPSFATLADQPDNGLPANRATSRKGSLRRSFSPFGFKVAPACPEALDGFAAPDSVFIGGGLSEASFARAFDALPHHGNLVAHAVTLESEALLLALHARYGGNLTRLAVAVAAPVGNLTGWRPQMPVTHWHLRKGAERT